MHECIIEMGIRTKLQRFPPAPQVSLTILPISRAENGILSVHRLWKIHTPPPGLCTMAMSPDSQASWTQAPVSMLT